MAGLRWFGLLDGDGPQDGLEELALASDEQRNGMLAQLLRDAYGAEFVDSLARTTPKLINERLAELGTNPSTHDKARSFFINAAKAIGLPLPAVVAKQARNKPTVPRKAGKAKPAQEEWKPPATPSQPAPTPFRSARRRNVMTSFPSQ